MRFVYLFRCVELVLIERTRGCSGTDSPAELFLVQRPWLVSNHWSSLSLELPPDCGCSNEYFLLSRISALCLIYRHGGISAWWKSVGKIHRRCCARNRNHTLGSTQTMTLISPMTLNSAQLELLIWKTEGKNSHRGHLRALNHTLPFLHSSLVVLPTSLQQTEATQHPCVYTGHYKTSNRPVYTDWMSSFQPKCSEPMGR